MGRWLTPRALGLGLIALTLMAAMGGLGWWQLTSYRIQQTEASRETLHAKPSPLDTVLGRDAPFPAAGVGHPIKASGTYDAKDQFYARHLPGTSAQYAVVTPLTTATGSMILVVRGGSPSPAARVPSGDIVIRGVLEPSSTTGSPLSETRVTSGVNIAALVNSMPRDLYAGYVVLTSSNPPETLPAVRPPVPQSSPWAGIRNLIYAIQWWVFAGFVAFMWWRIVSEDSSGTPVRTVGYGQSP